MKKIVYKGNPPKVGDKILKKVYIVGYNSYGGGQEGGCTFYHLSIFSDKILAERYKDHINKREGTNRYQLESEDLIYRWSKDF